MTTTITTTTTQATTSLLSDLLMKSDDTEKDLADIQTNDDTKQTHHDATQNTERKKGVFIG